jgi:hypothetical protein
MDPEIFIFRYIYLHQDAAGHLCIWQGSVTLVVTKSVIAEEITPMFPERKTRQTQAAEKFCGYFRPWECVLL